MARCDEGYLCDVCGGEVSEIVDSDLYLRYVLGEVERRELANAPERHIRCNPAQAQFIVDPAFAPATIDGPFDKRRLDAADVGRRELLVTRAWRRLQELPGSGLQLEEYPLRSEIRDRL